MSLLVRILARKKCVGAASFNFVTTSSVFGTFFLSLLATFAQLRIAAAMERRNIIEEAKILQGGGNGENDFGGEFIKRVEDRIAKKGT